MENVRNHGAAGDGQTDDTQAIRAAATAAGPGGTVYLPAGTYLVGKSDRVAFPYPGDGSWSNLTWKGDGADETIITMAGGQTKNHFIFHLKDANGASFQDLTVDGNKTAQSNDSVGLCFLCDGAGTFRMSGCHVTSAQNGNLKFNGRMDAVIENSLFTKAGYVWNGGHAISPNQNGQTTTTIRRCLFDHQRGADIDVGKGRDGDEQTVLIEECILRDSYRGSLKVNTSNAKTTLRNCLMRGNSDTEIPVKANPDPDDAPIGTVAIESCLIDGGKFPGIDLPRPGRLELSEVTVQNVGTGGHRGGAGIHSDGIRVDGGRVSIHGTDSQLNLVEGASGSISELIHDGQPAGSDNGIVKSRTQGDPLVPSLPRVSEIGPDGVAPADGGGSAPTPEEERPPTTTLTITGTGAKTDYLVETDGEVYPGEGVEQWDAIQEGAIDGWVTDEGDTDVFEITGSVTRVRFREGRATVTHDGADVTPPEGQYVQLRSSPDTSGGTPYSFVVQGTAEKGPNANANDTITENGDGTVTIEGQGGWGGTDDYFIQGDIVDAHWDPAQWSLFEGETEIPLSELEASDPEPTPTPTPTPETPAGDYHISASGSDANPGTVEAPLRTFAPLSEDGAHELTGGETVVVHGRVPISKGETLVCWDADDVIVRGVADAELDCTNYSGTVDDRPVLWFGRSKNVMVRDLEIHHAPASPIKFEDVATDAAFPFDSIEAMKVGGHVFNCDLHECGLPLRWGQGRGGVAERVESYGHFGPRDESRGSVVGGDADGIQFTSGPDDAESHLGGAVIDCSLHHNSDDGLDLYRAAGIVIADSVAYANGYRLDGESGGEAAGKGFKLGGTDSGFDTGGCLLVNSAAWGNGGVGIGFNGANLANDVWNCTALDNRRKQGGGYDIETYSTGGPSESTVADSTLYNTLSKAGINYFGLSLGDTEVEGCNFDRHGTIRPDWSEFTFESTARDGAQTPTNPEAFLRPAGDSQAIASGVATPTDTAAAAHHGHASTMAVGESPNIGAYPNHMTENGGQSGGGDTNDGNVGAGDGDGITFERTVDAVADLGLDASGETVIDDALASIEAGTKVLFPTGTYRIDSCWIRKSNVGLVAAAGADVTFVPATPKSESESWTLLLKTGGDHLISGLTFDYTEEGYGGSLIVVAQDGDFRIEDVRVRGEMPAGSEGIGCRVEDPAGVGTIKNCRLNGGGAVDAASHGLFVGKEHAGRLDIIDTEVCNWPDNGVYASSPGYIGSFRGTETTDRGDGAVHIQGGRFLNNNISNVRIGTTGASVRDATIGVMASAPTDGWDSREHLVQPRSGTEPEPVVNARGIWCKNRTDVLVENCELVMDSERASAAIMVDSAIGTATIRDTRIRVRSTECLYAIDAGSPKIEWPDTSVTMESVSVTGNGGSEGAAIRVRGRPDTVIRDSCIKVDGSAATGDEDGIRFDGAGGTVENTAISCSGIQVVNGQTSGLSVADSCPLPALAGETPDDGAGESETRTLPHTTTVRNVGETPVSFTIETTDGISRGVHEVPDDVARTVSGELAPGEETWFWFGGEVTAVSVEGPARVYVNGSDVSEEWIESPAPPEPVAPEDEPVTVVRVKDPARACEYGFRVDGEVVDVPASASVYAVSSVHVGTQRGWDQEFLIRGEVFDADWPAGARVTVGETVVQSGPIE